MEKIIFDALHAMCDGKTNQEEIAKGLGISRPYLNRLLNKKRPIDGITLRALRKLFPHATLHLQGDTVIAENTGINNGVLGVNHGTVNGGTPTASAEAFRTKAIAAMIDLDIPSDALREVLKTLKDLQITI